MSHTNQGKKWTRSISAYIKYRIIKETEDLDGANILDSIPDELLQNIVRYGETWRKKYKGTASKPVFKQTGNFSIFFLSLHLQDFKSYFEEKSHQSRNQPSAISALTSSQTSVKSESPYSSSMSISSLPSKKEFPTGGVFEDVLQRVIQRIQQKGYPDFDIYVKNPYLEHYFLWMLRDSQYYDEYMVQFGNTYFFFII